MRNRLRLLTFCRLLLLGGLFILFGPQVKAQNNFDVQIEGPEDLCQFSCGTYTVFGQNLPQPVSVLWTVNGIPTTTTSGGILVFCPSQYNVFAGQSVLSASVLGPNGFIASDTLLINVFPAQFFDIRSSNMAPCVQSDSSVCDKVCPGATVTYSLLSSMPGGTAPVAWNVTGATNWVVNNPGSGATQSSITVTWGGTGTGSVTASSDGIFACSAEGYLCVNIIESPQASFTTNPPPSANGTLTVCKNQTVYFQNQSSGGDIYEWSFNDDLTNSNEVNPEHTFQTPGTYTVTLIAISNCLCSDTTQMTVEVLDAAAPNLDCVGTVCPGEAVTYTASNGCQPFTWQVSPNGTVLGGGTANSDTIYVRWNNGPVGTITLGSQPCSGMLCPIPAVLEVPVISNNAEIEGRERVCPSSTETYSIEPFGGTSFTWTLASGGTILDGQGTNKVTVQWQDYASGSQDHWLSVVYENCYLGCGGADSLQVHVLPPFAITGQVETCANGNAILSAKLIPGAQFLVSNWTIYDPAGASVFTTSGLATIMPNFVNGAGIYRIVAVPANPALTCTDEKEWAVSVSPLPDEPTGITGERNICPNTTYTYEATGVLPNQNVKWTLVNGGGPAQTFFGNRINVTWAASGPYQLAAAAVSTNGLNCTSDTVRIHPVAIGIPGITGTTASCEDALGSYSIIPQEIQVNWTITPAGAGAVAEGQGSSAVDIFWTQPGNHTVNVAVCGQMASFPVTVWANPDPVAQSPAGLCPAATAVIQTTVPFTAYAWKDDDGMVLSNSATPSLGAGTFAVEVTDVNGCRGNSEFTIDSYDAPDVSLTTTDPTGFCNNSNYVLLTALTDADANYTYQWFQNATAIGGATSVEYATNQYGQYTVQATNSFGCTHVAGPINLFSYCGGGAGGYGPPGAGAICPPGAVNISQDPFVRCDSVQLHLVDNSGQYVSGSANWLFFISGGTVIGNASGDNPNFVFGNAGKYLVFMTAQLADGSTCKMLDSVKIQLVAGFDYVADCPVSTTTFEDVSELLPGNTITSYAWDFGDPASGAANTAAVADPQHDYAVSGIYNVQLTATASSGCTSSATIPVEVYNLPDPTFATPAAHCAGNALRFEPSSIPGDLLDVEWTFGDPTSGSADDAQGITVYHNYATPGTYTVTATATNVYGCTDTYSMPVTVEPNPLSGAISPAGTATFCEGSFVTLTAPAGAASYLWSDGNATTTQALQVTEAGVYQVTLTDANGCTYVPASVTVNMNPAPDALIKALLMNELGQVTGTSYPTLTICEGEDVHLQAYGDGAYTYNWVGGFSTTDELILSEDRGNQLIAGGYTYQVVATNPATGCTATSEDFSITVNPNPVIGAFTISSSSNCGQTSNVLTYSGTQNPGWQYIWSTGATGTTLTTEESGVFFLRVMNEFGCESKTNTVTILPGPQVSAIPSGCHERCAPDTLCIPNLPNITSWQWYLNGSPIAGATTPNLVVTESGSYYAVLSDASGCTAQSGPLDIQLNGGTGDLQGTVWSDVNHDDVVGWTADTTLAGITVMLLQHGIPIDTTISNGNGVFIFNDLPAGWYTVMLDSTTFAPGWFGVISKDSVFVSGCGEGIDPLELLMDYQCQPEFLDVFVSACEGSFYDFNGTLIPAGLSQVFQATNAAGCDVFTTVTVFPIPASFTSVTLSACPGSTVNYNGVDLPVGTVQPFFLVNAFGCDSTVTVTVTPAQPSSGTATLQACPGGTATYNGVDIPVGTTQIVTLVNAAGCDSIVTVTVNQLPASAFTLEVSVCPGETYLYQGVQIPAGQTQNFTLTNYLGCDSVVTVIVHEIQNPQGAMQVSVCPGATFEISGIQIPIGATQMVHLTSVSGCDSVVMVSVTAHPNASLALTTTESCPNAADGTLQINPNGGTPPFEYSIDNGIDWQPETLFEDLPAGPYTVKMRDGTGCIFENAMEITSLPEVAFGALFGVIPCDSTEITLSPELLSGDASQLKFLWSTGETTQSIRVSDAGTYTFSAQRIDGLCDATTGSAAVEWAELSAEQSLIYVPNVLSTEASDPENAAFRPRFAAGLTILKYDFRIFDRWGTEVFQTKDMSESWMGTFKGNKLRPGVWVWIMEADVSFCGRVIQIRKQGDVALIR